jgi:hypothetical protein
MRERQARAEMAPICIFSQCTHQVWFKINRELLLHGASQLETIARGFTDIRRPDAQRSTDRS